MDQKLHTALMLLQCEFVAERNGVNPEGLTWVQFDILTALRYKAYQPSQLSIQLGISRTKLSKSLAKLRTQNYILQKPSDQDHRVMNMNITSRGKQYLADIDKQHLELLADAQSVLTEAEQNQFVLIANKLISVLQERRGLNDGR